MNPYQDVTFFSFFWVLFKRIISGITQGEISLTTDEIQLIVLTSVGLITALLGVWLILQRQVMLANSLSHTTLLGIIAASLITGGFSETHTPPMTTLLIAALLSAWLTVLLTKLLHNLLRVQEGASIALAFTSLFALSIVLVNVAARSQHLSQEAIMGSLDLVSEEDLYISLSLAAFVVSLLAFFKKEITLSTLDSTFAKLVGFSPRRASLVILCLTAFTCILAFRVVGVIQVLAFLIIPPLLTKGWSRSILGWMIKSCIIATAFSFLGVALSRHIYNFYDLPLSTGALTVVLMGTAFIAYLTVGSFRRQKIVLLANNIKG